MPEWYLPSRDMLVMMRRLNLPGCRTAGAMLLSFGVAGCLVLSEYDQLEDREAPAGDSAPLTDKSTCLPAQVSCVNGQLRHCRDGSWEVLVSCDPTEFCSTELGRCTLCEPGRDTTCNGSRLERCRADGEGYELVQDCQSAGKVCDVALSPEACLTCRASDRRCDGDMLLRCSQGAFSEGQPCAAGPCQVVDGRRDYCPECSRPGEEACGARERVVCSDSYRLEVIEPCPEGCVAQGDATRCL